MRVILTLSILVAVFAFSRAEYPELSEGSMAEVERVRKFTEEEAVKATKFWLYTPRNKISGQLLRANDDTLLGRSNFDAKKPVRFLIHGFMNDGNSEFNKIVTKAYLDRGNFNVIVVDWGILSKNLLKYDDITASLHHLSLLVANMAKYLNKKGVSFKEMYVIGHSLGAHISGMAGQKLGNTKFGVIYGLDPAGPNFEGIPVDRRLDEGDADYVQTIQTDIVPHTATSPEGVRRTAANKLTTFGYMGVVGKATFFPNYGRSQPGCAMKHGCSHSRAYHYFAESLDNKYTFYGQRCGSYRDVLKKQCNGEKKAAIMGGEPAQVNNGIFYVEVDKDSPYSQFPKARRGLFG